MTICPHCYHARAYTESFITNWDGQTWSILERLRRMPAGSISPHSSAGIDLQAIAPQLRELAGKVDAECERLLKLTKAA